MVQMTCSGATLALGGSTSETFLVYSARVVDPDGNQLRLQVDARLVGTSFVAALGSSPYVPSGSIATVIVPLPPPGQPSPAGSYHVQMRTQDFNGSVSEWVTFGENAETDADFVCTWTAPTGTVPDVPAIINQYKSDGLSVIPVGGATSESRVIIKATITDPDAGAGVRLQIERRATGTAFTPAVTHSSPFVASGAETVIEITGLTAGSSHWQYRTQDGQGNVSAWTSFGLPNLDPGDADFTVSGSNTAPSVPTSPGQFTTADAAIATAGATQESTVRFRGTVSDPDAGNGVRFQVEVRPAASAFIKLPTGESTLLASGSAASIDIGGLPNGDYHWQYRTVDGSGATSAWTAFSGGTDFTVAVPPAVGGGGGGGGGGGCGCTGFEPIVLFVILLRRRRT